MSKFIGGLAIVALIIAGGIYLFGDENNTNEDNDPNTGSVNVSITDEAVNMENVSEVNLEIGDIQMHRADGEGWETVSNESKTYSLLELNETGEAKLYADANLAVGAYDEVRVKMSGVTVVTADGETQEATMIEDNFEIESRVQVDADSTTAIKLDFIASDSLYTAENGSYVFAPVVNMEVRGNAEVSTDENTNVVTATGGSVTTDTTVGVDVDGSTKANFTLGENAQINILENGEIQVLQSNSSQNNTEAQSQTQTETEANIEVDAEETVNDTRDTVEDTTSEVEAEAEAGVNAGTNIDS